PALLRSRGARLARQLGGGDEQLALEAEEDPRQLPEPDVQRAEPVLDAELGAGDAEGRDGLFDRAVGLRPEIVLADAVATEEQPGRAVVAAACGDRGLEHRLPVLVRHRSAGCVTTSGRRRAGPSARPAG